MEISHFVFNALIFFGAGHVFGHLTRNINTLKIIILLLIGAAVYLLFLDMNWVQKTAFLFGIISHHIPRFVGIFLWASDAADFIYAFRYRSAYEDIRRRERELDEREERLRQRERKQQCHEDEQSGAGGDWQDEAKGFRDKARDDAGKEKAKSERQSYKQSEDTSEKKQSQQKQRQQRSSHSSGQQQNSGNSQSRANSSAETARERNLRILGLEPKGSYTQDEIKIAHRKMAMKYHPDRNNGEGEDIMKKINNARDELLQAQ